MWARSLSAGSYGDTVWTAPQPAAEAALGASRRSFLSAEFSAVAGLFDRMAKKAMSPTTTMPAATRPPLRAARRRAILRRTASRCRRASSFRTTRLGPPSVAGAALMDSGSRSATWARPFWEGVVVALVAGRRPVAGGARLFFFFAIHQSGYPMARVPTRCPSAESQLLGMVGYLNSTG